LFEDAPSPNATHAIGLVHRYQPRTDGADDGVFLVCSFWLADPLALRGKLDEARDLFERLLDLRRDVGLLSEEHDRAANRGELYIRGGMSFNLTLPLPSNTS
jgi:GH15 family glucan-1,4-alpha-glucosidase